MKSIRLIILLLLIINCFMSWGQQQEENMCLGGIKVISKDESKLIGKAFINIHQYTPQFAFSTWLFRIASNNAIDFMRKKRAVTIPLEMSNPADKNHNLDRNISVHEDTDTPEESYIRGQKAKILRKIVAKLKPRYRNLLELRYFKEYSYEEIAEELNLPLGTVKVQLFRSREMLFDLLKGTELSE